MGFRFFWPIGFRFWKKRCKGGVGWIRIDAQDLW